ADASKRERMLLERFVRAGRRNTHAVISLNEDVVMANTAASQLLDASDQAMLWDWACTVLSSRDAAAGELRLSRDLVVPARATGTRAAPGRQQPAREEHRPRRAGRPQRRGEPAAQRRRGGARGAATAARLRGAGDREAARRDRRAPPPRGPGRADRAGRAERA